MKALILAGGKGTRLQPYTTVIPKPLMPMGNMPVLELILRQIKAHGVSEVILAVGYLGDLIQAYFGDGSKLGLKISYSQEDAPLGTAGPIAPVIDELEEDFLLLNGDLLTTLNFGRFMAFHKAKRPAATIAVYRRELKLEFGLIEMDREGRMLEYREKPSYEHNVSMGLYVLNSAKIRPYLQEGKHLDMPELMLGLKNDEQPVFCYQEDCFWLDIGMPSDYQAAVDLLESGKTQFLPEPPAAT